MKERKYIKIRGANEHNLKHLDIDIPRNEFVVLTGLSGSGKSSLAFDTPIWMNLNVHSGNGHCTVSEQQLSGYENLPYCSSHVHVSFSYQLLALLKKFLFQFH